MIRATKEDKALVVGILSQAFKENPSVLSATKNGSEKNVRRLMEYAFFSCMKDGDVFLDASRQACLLTVRKKTTTLRGIWNEIRLVINCIGLKKLSGVLKKEKELKASRPTVEHVYLWFIGTAPAGQGKGLGSSLLREYRSNIKAPILLETSIPRNLSFYKRLGFTVYQELNVGYRLFMLKSN